MHNPIQYLRVQIGRLDREIELPKSAPKAVKDRIKEEVLAERAAHARLEAKFGCGTRLLVVIRPRRVHCTVIHAPTLAYIADFEKHWLVGAPALPMTRHSWRRLATLMESTRRLLMPRARDKQAETIKDAIALARSRIKRPN